jgi:hypothetical protein
MQLSFHQSGNSFAKPPKIARNTILIAANFRGFKSNEHDTEALLQKKSQNCQTPNLCGNPQRPKKRDFPTQSQSF